MTLLILAIIIGILPAAIAHGKGGNFLLWWIFGSALFIVALPCAILKKPDNPD
jgi:cation transport ATPase